MFHTPVKILYFFQGGQFVDGGRTAANHQPLMIKQGDKVINGHYNVALLYTLIMVNPSQDDSTDQLQWVLSQFLWI